MGERGVELARRFREAYDPVVAWIEGADDAAWTRHCEGDNATAGAVMEHAAMTFRFFGAHLKAAREGQPPIALTQDTIDATNDSHKEMSKAPVRDEVLASMRDGLERLTKALGDLDDHLFTADRPIVVGDHTVANLDQFVKWVAIPHGRDHLKAITDSGPAA